MVKRLILIFTCAMGALVLGAGCADTSATKATVKSSGGGLASPQKMVEHVKDQLKESFPEYARKMNVSLDKDESKIYVRGNVPTSEVKDKVDLFIGDLKLKDYKIVNELKIGKGGSVVKGGEAHGEAAVDDEGTAVAEDTTAETGDGQPVTLKGYKINGKTYVLLKEAAKKFEFKIKWDKETEAVVIKLPGGKMSSASESLGQCLMQRGKMFVTPEFIKKELKLKAKVS